MLCVSALCADEREPALLPVPLDSLERAAAAGGVAPQVPALEETLVALHVVIKLSFPDPIPQQAWAVADSHAEHMASSKLVSAASQECKWRWVWF